MKLHSNYPIIYTIICIIALGSCTENIPIDLGKTNARLVVDGAITTDTIKHKVRLTKSGDALYQQPVQVISNALVSILDGSNEFVLLENSVNKGVYETDPSVYGIPGKTYTLHISHVDIDGDGVFEEYSAQSYLKKENPIDSIKITYDDRNPDYSGWTINLYAHEIGGGRNFYLMKAYKNNVLLTDSTSEYANMGDNTGFNGGYYDGFPVYMLQKKKLDEKIQKGDKITLEMDGITEEYFNFITDYIQEYNPKMPIFSGPSANISTNIEPNDKAVGFFAAYSIARCSRVY
ncbi:MAG: DUF4249 domain-containing protein [Bacteroidales bacterium]|nr:DUF4249 domain-containing protein [Bacteroidales bacterium]